MKLGLWRHSRKTCEEEWKKWEKQTYSSKSHMWHTSKPTAAVLLIVHIVTVGRTFCNKTWIILDKDRQLRNKLEKKSYAKMFGTGKKSENQTVSWCYQISNLLMWGLESLTEDFYTVFIKTREKSMIQWSNLSLQSISHDRTTFLPRLWPSGPNPDPCFTNLTSVISLSIQAE